ncbi:hypothetical protein LTR53_011403 [Teratosphaeriaceae sp. CCFEE 6253]|nr:hypothetical protein LTR53_011403 [Teratosphaeriaceae sp. CCFEE 6253]
MAPFGYSFRRTLDLFRDPRCNGRAAKMRDLRAEIRESSLSLGPLSPISEASVTSPKWLSGYEVRREGPGHGPETEHSLGNAEETPDQIEETAVNVSEIVEVEKMIKKGTGIGATITPAVERDLSTGLGPQQEIVASPPQQEPPVRTEGSRDRPEEQAELIGEQAAHADPQTLREEAYVVFEGVDETDFTEGPSRIVLASDGVNAACSALLLTLDLSAKIQEAVKFGRDLVQVEKESARDDRVNAAFERELNAQVSRHRHGLAILGRRDNDDERSRDDEADVGNPRNRIVADKDDQSTEEMRAIQFELEKLEMLVENTKAKRSGFAAQVKFKTQMFREVQAEMNALLEEAFVDAALLEPVEEELEVEIEKIEVEAEYQSICRMAQSDASNDRIEITPLRRYDENFKPPSLSPADQAIAGLKEVYWDAQRDLQHAQALFDHRVDTRALELQARHFAVAQDQPAEDDSPEAFDLRWFVRIQELTRGVIDAEASVAEARAALLEAGGRLDERDQESGFGDHASDGYRMSLEAAWVVDAQGDEKVRGWFDGLPDLVNMIPIEDDADSDVDVEGWDARSVDVEDSASFVAEGTARRKIDKWRQTCGA